MSLPAEKPISDPADEPPFWRRKAMKDMTPAEWESLCDGCGRCCLNKLQEEGSDRTYYTDVGCKLLDGQSCRCTDYADRSAKVKDCVTLTSRNINRISWLPPTCGYRLVAQGKDLYWWHPLVSGDPETVHAAGVSPLNVPSSLHVPGWSPMHSPSVSSSVLQLEGVWQFLSSHSALNVVFALSSKPVQFADSARWRR